MPKKVDKKKSIGSGVSSWFKWGRGTTVPITSPPPPPPPPPLLEMPAGVSTSGTDFIPTHTTYVTAAITTATTTTSSVTTKSSLVGTPLQSTSPIPSPPSSIKMTNSEEDLQEKVIF